MRPVVASGVGVRYGDVVALQDVDVVAQPGRLLVVTGPSGAGKSTLLWALAGLHPLSTGRVVVGDVEVSDHAAAVRAGVVLLPQGNGLASVLTARENVAAPLFARGAPRDEVDRATASALDAVGLAQWAHHLVDELSGGQQQRVGIARALVSSPVVLLADEPTSELDAGNRGRVLTLLRELADAGTTVLLSTHDPEVAQAADAELRLREGRVVPSAGAPP